MRPVRYGGNVEKKKGELLNNENYSSDVVVTNGG